MTFSQTSTANALVSAPTSSAPPVSLGSLGQHPAVPGPGSKAAVDSSQTEVVPAATMVMDETDPSLPQNWSSRRRWLILIVLSLVSLMV